MICGTHQTKLQNVNNLLTTLITRAGYAIYEQFPKNDLTGRRVTNDLDLIHT
jgi:hypothetical protein